ncbi:MAG: MBL fold metallo-hydrolase [Gemmatimonadales bacterium]|nr:MBL fold metallo-hydrolase [Gemmatimonadales bacterium]
MTRLHVLGSGSKGNAFALEHEGRLLILEAGFSLREIDRRLDRAGLDPARVDGVAVTHEHGDHAVSAIRLARRHGVPLCASLGTWRALSKGGDPCDWLPLGSRGPVTAGPFQIEGCPTSHDAAEPVALGVRLPDGAALGMATDLGRPTQAVRWFLRERHCLVLEANHDELMLRTSGYPAVVQDRIAGHGGHLSNDACAQLLAELHHEQLATVVLAHLSQRCNSPEAAREAVLQRLDAAGFLGELHLADQDGGLPPIAVQAPLQGAMFD